jgi:hypothetical protein
MYGIGRAEAARFERDSRCFERHSKRCFERHSKKAWAPFRSLFHKPFTSVHTGRVVHLILESLCFWSFVKIV